MNERNEKWVAITMCFLLSYSSGAYIKREVNIFKFEALTCIRIFIYFLIQIFTYAIAIKKICPLAGDYLDKGAAGGENTFPY